MGLTATGRQQLCYAGARYASELLGCLGLTLEHLADTIWLTVSFAYECELYSQLFIHPIPL